MIAMRDELRHHGILGMQWGKRNGPPYPLSDDAHSAKERKRGWKRSLDTDTKKKIGKAAVIAGVAAIGAVSLYALYRSDQNQYANAKSLLDYVNNATRADRRSPDHADKVKAASNVAARFKKRYDIEQQIDQGLVDRPHKMYENLYRKSQIKAARDADRSMKRELRTARKEDRRQKVQAAVNIAKAGYNKAKSTHEKAKTITGKVVKTGKKVINTGKKIKRDVGNFVNRRVRPQPAGRFARYTVKDRRDYLE